MAGLVCFGRCINTTKNITYLRRCVQAKNTKLTLTRKLKTADRTFAHKKSARRPYHFGALFLAAAVKTGAEKSKTSEEIHNLMNNGQKILKRNGNLSTVETLYMKALHLSLQSKNREQIAFVQDHLANLMLRQNKLDEAQKLFQNVAQNLVALGVPEGDPSILEISLKLATIAAHKGDHELAMTCYEFAITESKNNLNKVEDKNKTTSKYLNQIALLGMILDSYGRFLFVINQFEKSLEITQEACDISLETFGENDLRTIVLYNMLSILNAALENDNDALVWAKKCTTQAEMNNKILLDSDMVIFWTNIACVYQRLNQNPESNEAFKKALYYAVKSGDNSLHLQVQSHIAQEEHNKRKNK